MSTTPGATDDKFSQQTKVPPQFDTHVTFTVYESLLIPIAVCIVIINIYVTSLFIRKRSLRKSSSLLLFSLTMADLFTGTVTVPLLIASTPLQKLNFEKFKIVFILGDVATVMSASLIIMSLCAVTADRYFRLCHPIKHMILTRRNRVLTLFCAIWSIAIIYSLIPFSWLYQVLKRNPSLGTYARVDELDTRYSIVGAAIFAVPVCGLTIAFARMFYAIHKLGCHEQRLSTDTSHEQRRQKRERKAIIVFSLMFVLFIICWAPWILLRPFAMNAAFNEIPVALLNALMLIRFLTAIFNPLLYTFHEHDFHRALITDKDAIVSRLMCNERRRRSASGATESFYKLTLLRSSRKGTFTSMQKSQENAEQATQLYVPSPIIVRNGRLHPATNNLNQASNPPLAQNCLDTSSEIQSLPVSAIPTRENLDVEKDTVPRIKVTFFENEMEESEGCTNKLSYRHKDFKSTYDNVDEGLNIEIKDTSIADRSSATKAVRFENGIDDMALEKGMAEVEFSEGCKDSTCQECEDKNYEQEISTSGFHDRDEEERMPGKKERTASLLKTSHIARLFQADDLL